MRAVLFKEIATGVMRSAVGVLKESHVINWKDMGRMIPLDRSTVEIIPRDTTLVRIGTVPSVPPISIRSQ